MIKADVTLDSDLLLRIQTFLKENGTGGMPNTKAAFTDAARAIQSAWQNWALGGTIEGAQNIKKPSAKLARSIKIHHSGAMDVSIETDSLQMQQIQTGRKPFDLKETHPYGNKSRVSKEGIPYLIIPFAWMTPNKDGTPRAHATEKNTITLEAYKLLRAKSFKRMLTTGTVHMEKNYKGIDIPRADYNEGYSSLDTGDKKDWMNGMVKSGMPRHTHYTTFRIISANSPKDSWIAPKNEIPANDVVGALAKQAQESTEAIIDAGFKADLYAD